MLGHQHPIQLLNIERDGLFDVLASFLACAALAHAAGERWHFNDGLPNFTRIEEYVTHDRFSFAGPLLLLLLSVVGIIWGA
jgi:hypothetical protein